MQTTAPSPDFRLTRCPECGGHPTEIQEVAYGGCGLVPVEGTENGYDYAGDGMEVEWDTVEPDLDGASYTLACEKRHTWAAPAELDPANAANIALGKIEDALELLELAHKSVRPGRDSIGIRRSIAGLQDARREARRILSILHPDR